MTELLLTLVPILLVDVLNPVLFALLIIAAGSKRPVLNASAMLLGHTAAYFAAGLALSFAVTAISHRLQNPQALDMALAALIGLGCIVWFGYNRKRAPGTNKQPDAPGFELTPLRCLGFGVVINVLGLPFALPYLAALDLILQADVSYLQAWLALVFYNGFYALPFAMVPLLVGVMGVRAQPVLARLNSVLIAIADKGMPWLILALGIYLLADGIHYFVAAGA